MRDLLKKFRNGLVAGLGFISAVALIPTGFAAISTYTGTSGSNPIQGIPGTMVDFNTLIGAVWPAGTDGLVVDSIERPGAFAEIFTPVW